MWVQCISVMIFMKYPHDNFLTLYQIINKSCFHFLSRCNSQTTPRYIYIWKLSPNTKVINKAEAKTKYIYILSVVALYKTSISSCLHFLVRNIEMSYDLVRASGRNKVNVSQ